MSKLRPRDLHFFPEPFWASFWEYVHYVRSGLGFFQTCHFHVFVKTNRQLPLHQVQKDLRRTSQERLAIHSALNQKCHGTSWTKLRSGRPSPERIPAQWLGVWSNEDAIYVLHLTACGPRPQHQILAVQSWPGLSPFSTAMMCWRLHFWEWTMQQSLETGQTSHSWFCYLISMNTLQVAACVQQ